MNCHRRWSEKKYFLDFFAKTRKIGHLKTSKTSLNTGFYQEMGPSREFPDYCILDTLNLGLVRRTHETSYSQRA
jgi:hypothetical protein